MRLLILNAERFLFYDKIDNIVGLCYLKICQKKNKKKVYILSCLALTATRRIGELRTQRHLCVVQCVAIVTQPSARHLPRMSEPFVVSSSKFKNAVINVANRFSLSLPFPNVPCAENTKSGTAITYIAGQPKTSFAKKVQLCVYRQRA